MGKHQAEAKKTSEIRREQVQRRGLVGMVTPDHRSKTTATQTHITLWQSEKASGPAKVRPK